jgi:hypothetical protein
MDDITNHQPALVVQLPDSLHVISIVQVRQLAAGVVYRGDKDAMIRLLAQAVKELVDE